MDERFIPLLFALPASTSADVRFYDDLKSDVEASRARFDGKTSSYMGAPDLGSHIGIRNSHPIGDGSSVVWQMEQDTPLGRDRDDRQNNLRHGRDSGEVHIGIGYWTVLRTSDNKRPHGHFVLSNDLR